MATDTDTTAVAEPEEIPKIDLDESTPEQRTQWLADLKSARAGDTEGEDTSDSERLARDHDEGNTPGSRHSTDDGPADDDGGEDVGETEETAGSQKAPSWLTEDHRSEIDALGLSDDDLAGIETVEEFDRAMLLLQKSLATAGGDDKGPKGEKPAKRESDDDNSESTSKESSFEIDLDTDIYDRKLVDTITEMRDHYDGRIERLAELVLTQSHQSQEHQLDRLIEGIEFGELFGKTGAESKVQLARRAEVVESVQAQVLGMEQLGKTLPLTQSLVTRIAHSLFASDFAKRDLKNRTRRVGAQSKRRTSSDDTKPRTPQESVREKYIRKYNELDQD